MATGKVGQSLGRVPLPISQRAHVRQGGGQPHFFAQSVVKIVAQLVVLKRLCPCLLAAVQHANVVERGR